MPQEGEVKPLVLTLSPEVQKGVFSALLDGLAIQTNDEIAGFITKPSDVAELEGARAVFLQVVDSLKIELDTEAALRAGIVHRISSNELGMLADNQNPLRKHAEYFRAKMAQKTEPPPSPQ